MLRMRKRKKRSGEPLANFSKGRIKSMRERRKFHRIPQPIDARYRVSGDFGLAWAKGNLVNISATGLRFRAEELLEKGAMVEIEAKMPGLKELLIVRGMVVWSSLQASGVAEMGIEFYEVSVPQQYQIDNLVSFLRSSGTQRTLPPKAP